MAHLKEHEVSDLRSEVLREVYVPSLLMLLLASFLHVLVNTLVTAATRRDTLFRKTIHRWSRALWLLQKSTFVLVQPTRNPMQAHAVPVQRQRMQSLAKRSNSRTHLFEESEGTDTQPLVSTDGQRRGGYGAAHTTTTAPPEEQQPIYRGNASFFRDLDSTQPLPRSDDLENRAPLPSTAVASPVFAEVLRQSWRDARQESQRLVLPFHPAFMIASACKCFVLVIYIHYHFVAIDGGWRRLCVCGTANIMAGAITPVLGYALAYLLPVDGTPGLFSWSAISSEESKDSVFIVQLLLQISRVELDDLSTVLVQGTAFVVLTAVLIPVFLALGVLGGLAYAWLFAGAWGLWYAIRQAYYHPRAPVAADREASSGAREVPSRVKAFVGSAGELMKVFALKTLTLWLLWWSVQAVLLLGLGASWSAPFEWRVYKANLSSVLALQCRGPHLSSWSALSLFFRICIGTLLFL